ncbi:MAG TPA: endo-1,4-beta-xylanase [bacterium]
MISRRDFLKGGAAGVSALATASLVPGWRSVYASTQSDLVFKLYPHHWMPEVKFAYAADEMDDPFKSATQVTQEGIVVPKEMSDRRFSVNARWFVPGFGFVNLAADNAGEYYSAKDFVSTKSRVLNFEFARSRVSRNERIRMQYENAGTKFSSEARHLLALSDELFDDAQKKQHDGERCARLADQALHYALGAGEKMELERAASATEQWPRTDNVYFGCESRQYIWAKSEEFTKRFVELFNFATVTHYVWDTWYELFEPSEGEYNWGVKDNIVNWLGKNNITIQGRPLFWFHPSVTPDWLKNKNLDEVKRYVERHTRDVVSHYGDRVLQWEVVNEYHDWGNIHDHTPEQITDIVRLACDKTKEVNPHVTRIINNCCLWAEYAAMGRRARADATRPQRSARKFIEDLLNAGVDFDVIGIQIYFPRRDLSDIVRMVERFERFGKPIYITEIGASAGPLQQAIATGEQTLPTEPYDWHRYWDEELQADWLEQVYTLYYSRQSIKAINWYDFSNFRPFIHNGGLVREDCSTKASFHRLKNLLQKWNRLPGEVNGVME